MSLNGRRPRIAFQINNLMGKYAATLWNGVIDNIEKNDCDLVTFQGDVAYNNLDRVDHGQAVVYDFLNKNNVDGVVMAAGTICNTMDKEEFDLFCEKFRSVPIVSIGVGMKGAVSIMADNRKGLYDLLCHLTDIHGYRRLAFIRGPENNDEAEERYRTYLQFLKDKGIPFNQDIVELGAFTIHSGMEAMKRLLEKQRGNFEVVVAANDDMAFGVMDVLREMKVKVPQEIAVTGFDDVSEARFREVPLTTVEQQLYQQAFHATQILIDILSGKEPPENIITPTKPVIRSSCGCNTQPIRTIVLNYSPEDQGAPSVCEEQSYSEEDKKRFGDWINLFQEYIDGGESDQDQALQLIKQFDLYLNDEISRGLDVSQWQNIASMIYNYAGLKAANRRMDLLQFVQITIAEKMQLQHSVLKMRWDFRIVELMNIIQRMIAKLTINDLMDTITLEFPKLGIHGCYIALYNGEFKVKKDLKWTLPKTAVLKLAFLDSERTPLDGGIEYPLSKGFLPEGILPEKRRFNFIVNELLFMEEQFGLVFYAPGPKDGVIYELLTLQISSVLKAAYLIEAREKAEKQLQRVNHQLLEKQKETEADFLQAALMQKTILTQPDIYHKIPEMDIDVVFLPMNGFISGDYYNISSVRDGNIRIMIADVTGHGIQAALSTMQMDLLNKESQDFKYPDEQLEFMNEKMHERLVSRNFFTAFIAQLHSDTIYYSSAAHPQQYLLKKNTKEIIPLKTKGKILGALPENPLEMKNIRIEKGDILFLYTDGIASEVNGNNEQFGDQALEAVLRRELENEQLTPKSLNSAVLKNFEKFVQKTERSDDITLICLKMR